VADQNTGWFLAAGGPLEGGLTHSVYTETAAVVAAFLQWGRRWRGKVVFLHSDSTSAVHSVERWGSGSVVKHPLLLALAQVALR